MDFTLQKYTNLLTTLKQAGFLFQTFWGVYSKSVAQSYCSALSVGLVQDSFWIGSGFFFIKTITKIKLFPFRKGNKYIYLSL